MDTQEQEQNNQLIDTVDTLNENVKQIAVDLALYLAKVKKDSQVVNKMEPQFIRLVNTTIKVVQKIAVVIRAASNNEKVQYHLPSSRGIKDQVEVKLNSIMEQCAAIMHTLKNEGQPADWP